MNADLPINAFDLAIYAYLAVAVFFGYRSGLLRSLATIFGYVIAAPVAITAMSYLTPLLAERLQLPPQQSSLAYFAVFFILGILLAALLRGTVGEISGPQIGPVDRAAGALLGALRVVLVAVLLVMVFERIIPAGREPAFLRDSQLRPILSQAGSAGLRSLPPDITDYIDRLKRENGL